MYGVVAIMMVGRRTPFCLFAFHVCFRFVSTWKIISTMSKYKHIPIISNLLESIADIFCTHRLDAIKEVGIFRDSPPKDVSSALSQALRVIDGHVGLASWSLTPLYAECKSRLLADPDDIRAATALLAASPDYFTAWNCRKMHISRETAAQELTFCKLLLTRSPKSAETWAHRAWVIRAYGCDIMDELAICWSTASRVPHNYYAGVHRLRMLPNMNVDVVRAEVAKAKKWLQIHVSDSSGWWYYRTLRARLTSLTADTNENDVWFEEMQTRYKGRYQNIELHATLQRKDAHE